MSTYHGPKCVVNAGRREAGWPRSGNARLKEGGKLQCAPHRRPPFPLPGHGQLSSQRRRVGRSVASRLRRTARDAGPRIGVPSGEEFRAIYHAAGVHQASVGARNGYLCVVVLGLTNRVI